MKRVLDIGSLGDVYVEHDTPLTKPTLYKPKPSTVLGGAFGPGANDLVNRGLSHAWAKGGGTSPSRPKPTPARPGSTPSAPPGPPAPVAPAPAVAPELPERPIPSPTAQGSAVLPWVLGGVGLLLAGGIGWAIYHHQQTHAAPVPRQGRAP